MSIKNILSVLLACGGLAACASVGGGPEAGSLVISADGQEVTDTVKGRIWRRCVEGMTWRGSACEGAASTFSYDAAEQHAKKESAASGKPWRAPTVQELGHLLDKKFSPAINPEFFPATPASQFWSSTEINQAQYNAFDDQATYAWVVDFARGRSGGTISKERGYLRLVRSAK